MHEAVTSAFHHQIARGSVFIIPSPPGAAKMGQCAGPALQIMACRLFGAKPLPEPMLAYFQFDYWKHISVKFESEFYNCHSRKWN